MSLVFGNLALFVSLALVVDLSYLGFSDVAFVDGLILLNRLRFFGLRFACTFGLRSSLLVRFVLMAGLVGFEVILELVVVLLVAGGLLALASRRFLAMTTLGSLWGLISNLDFLGTSARVGEDYCTELAGFTWGL